MFYCFYFNTFLADEVVKEQCHAKFIPDFFDKQTHVGH